MPNFTQLRDHWTHRRAGSDRQGLRLLCGGGRCRGGTTDTPGTEVREQLGRMGCSGRAETGVTFRSILKRANLRVPLLEEGIPDGARECPHTGERVLRVRELSVVWHGKPSGLGWRFMGRRVDHNRAGEALKILTP